MALHLRRLSPWCPLAPCKGPWEAQLEPETLGSLELPGSALMGIWGCHSLGALARRKSVPPALAMTLDTAGMHAGPAHPKLGLALPVHREMLPGPLQTPFGGCEAHSCAFVCPDFLILDSTQLTQMHK